MVPAELGFCLLLVASVCFPVVKLLDVYEDNAYIPKDKPVSRQLHNPWYVQPTPRLGKRRLENENEVYHTKKCYSPFPKYRDFPEYEVKDGGGDNKDNFYKIRPLVEVPSKETYL